MTDVYGNGQGGHPGRPVVERIDGGLPRSARLEQFSLAFVHLVAAAAGCSIKSHATDYDGVDITIAASAEYETYYCPEFELQVKCTTQRELLRDDHMVWTLTRDRFLKLVHPKRYNLALLGVLLLPEGPDRMLDLSEEGVRSSGRMYFEYASRLGGIEDGKASKTVRLPRSNLFDVEGLQEIMRNIGDGGQW
ncbi:protein of unknown function (DUF4365) [Streptoalloteichus tenebrarius]|uniref:DUF4365 domain-containing protein n=1 Tax=Streptoalloteichus tenebrarius (strain ATCC 17920 / DSM 40477 / JCM 4838 / CBS 697.72 / NBRC 16177 / NCIMB 11028 / NRRL B-12390 / A12253. 1 / ISP 5477) TaxID=1933 RepID=A0ABT1HRP6_STRSD|nr:DUF4365 domain-containing protein [Streptoalloteichus tenebrarius]MCP2258195.1 protein of unknown function (DUF4365) [Streptoalloteichus tenebrarius]BFF04576.1 DUF4365 domain-containing protein [Streptoalloteichus tenebrarius]